MVTAVETSARYTRKQIQKKMRCSFSTVRRYESLGKFGVGTFEPATEVTLARWTFDAAIVDKFLATFVLDKSHIRHLRTSDGITPRKRRIIMQAIGEGMSAGEIVRLTGADEALVARLASIESLSPKEVHDLRRREEIEKRAQQKARIDASREHQLRTLRLVSHNELIRQIGNER